MAIAMEFSPSPSPSLLQANCSSRSRASRASLSMATVGRTSAALADFTHDPSALSSSSSSSSSDIPKMEPFNRSRVARLTREPSLLDKAEHLISDRCSVLEGDDAYECWEALFEFEDMKVEYRGQCSVAAAGERQTACRPLERLENFVRQSGGVATLINNVRMLAQANKMRKEAEEETSKQERVLKYAESSKDDKSKVRETYTLEPGSLPPTEEELELERNSMMPESRFTSVLRAMGIPSPWLSQPFER